MLGSYNNSVLGGRVIELISPEPYELIFKGFEFDSVLDIEAVEEINQRTTEQAIRAMRTGNEPLVDSLNYISRVCCHAIVTNQKVIFSTGVFEDA